VVVGSAPVVVGPVVVGSVLVVVASVVVVVDVVVVVGAVVGGAVVVVGPVSGGWVLVTPKVDNASLLLVVVSAAAGARALADPAVVVGLLGTGRTVSGVVVERVGAVVGARGPVVGVSAGLEAGSVGTVGRARAGAWFGGDGWGSRVAEATRAARTAVVSPKAISMRRQGHRDLVRCRGGDGRCRGGGVDMGMSRFDGIFKKACTAHFLGALPCRIPLRRWPCSPWAAGSTAGTRSMQSTAEPRVSLPGRRRAGRSMVVASDARLPPRSAVNMRIDDAAGDDREPNAPRHRHLLLG
jgi:hypothetical protein